jgi:hypothetical protein
MEKFPGFQPQPLHGVEPLYRGAGEPDPTIRVTLPGVIGDRERRRTG